LRLRYAKRGRLRFASHRDFQRAFERALRRAGVPMAYSAGFSPHPKISYANAAPTGTASEAEYLEIGLAEVCDPQDLRRRIDEALPPGLDILDVVVARTSDFADRLQASCWRIRSIGSWRQMRCSSNASQRTACAPSTSVPRCSWRRWRLPTMTPRRVRY
jgi:radical SAM-linked protein